MHSKLQSCLYYILELAAGLHVPTKGCGRQVLEEASFIQCISIQTLILHTVLCMLQVLWPQIVSLEVHLRQPFHCLGFRVRSIMFLILLYFHLQLLCSVQ
jgi:hypothetical protein